MEDSEEEWSSDASSEEESDEEGERFRAAQTFLPERIRREGQCSLLGLQRRGVGAAARRRLQLSPMQHWDAARHAQQLKCATHPWIDQPQLDVPMEACLEDNVFTTWLEHIYALEKDGLLNAFDQDRAVWARLHRLVSLNDVILLTVDCRWPQLQCPLGVLRFIRRVSPTVPIVLVLTKMDLVAETTVLSWEATFRHLFTDILQDANMTVLSQSCFTPATADSRILPNDDSSLTALKVRTKRFKFRRRFPYHLRDLITALLAKCATDLDPDLVERTLAALPVLPTAHHANGRAVVDVQWQDRGQRQRSHRRKLRKMEVEHFGRAGIKGGIPAPEVEEPPSQTNNPFGKVRVAVLGMPGSGANTLYDQLYAFAAPLFDLPSPLVFTAPMLLPLPALILSGQLRPPNQIEYLDALHVVMHYLPVPTLLGLDAKRFMTKSEAKVKTWSAQEIIEGNFSPYFSSRQAL